MDKFFDKEVLSEKRVEIEEKNDSKTRARKKYNFYIGFGWLSDDELFELRQTDPRIAP